MCQVGDVERPALVMTSVSSVRTIHVFDSIPMWMINLYTVHSLCGTSTGIHRSEWKASYVGTSTVFVLQLGRLQFSQCRLSLCWHFGQVKVRIRDFRRYVGFSSLALRLSVQCCSLSLKLSSDVLCIRGVWCSPNVNIFDIVLQVLSFLFIQHHWD